MIFKRRARHQPLEDQALGFSERMRRVVKPLDYDRSEFCEAVRRSKGLAARVNELVCLGRAYPVRVRLPDGDEVVEFRMRYTLDYLAVDERHRAYVLPVGTHVEGVLLPESFDRVLEEWETWRPRSIEVTGREPFDQPYRIRYPYDPEGETYEEYVGVIETRMGRFLVSIEQLGYLYYATGENPVWKVILSVYERVGGEKFRRAFAEGDEKAMGAFLLGVIEVAIMRDLGLLY